MRNNVQVSGCGRDWRRGQAAGGLGLGTAGTPRLNRGCAPLGVCMTADAPSLLALARPSLADLRVRVRSTLPAESLAQVDAHATQAERLLEEVFAGLIVWSLNGSQDLWARAQDVADLMGVDRSAVTHQIENAKARGDLKAEDVRRGVKQSDVSTSIVSDAHNSVTTSPRGCTMLNLRAIRRLVMTCDGDRGVRFRDGLDKALELADQAERAILELVLASQSGGLAPVAFEGLARRIEALEQVSGRMDRLETAMVKLTELVTTLASAGTQPAQGPRVTVNAPGAQITLIEPTPPPGFTISGIKLLASIEQCSHPKLRKRLETVGLWEDPEWMWVGERTIPRGNRLDTETFYRFKPSILPELKRRENPLPFPGRGDA